MHASNYFYNAENLRLADELCQRTGFDRAFFCNSGAEANEAMIKLARHHFWGLGQKDRFRLIAFEGSFHGRTLGALALTGNAKYQEGFGPRLEGVTHCAYGDALGVRKAMGPDVAGIVVEPVLGEGGVVVAPPGFLAALRGIADEHGALLLIDEVQTGLGRTGTFLGADHDGVRGDAIALAKGLAGGFPIGAMLVRESLAGALPPGTHGSTFGGNCVGSAAARTVLRVLDDERLVEGARVKGERLAQGLARLVSKHPHLCTGARGRGLLQALVLAPGIEPRTLLGALQARGILLTAAGPALRFSPPLVIREAEIDEGLAIVDEVLASLPATKPAP
jgi:acetylornithine/N-succinyldiaminopimelate aminotransferase